MRKFFIYTIIIFPIAVSAQVTADFNLPVEVCLEEQFQLENNSTNANRYEWDFCTGDLQNNNLEISSNNEGNLSVPVGASFIRVEEDWYAFTVNVNNNSITKLSFGNNPNNAPNVTNLGNYGGELSQPEDIKVVHDNDSIYLFVSNRTNNKLIRINLGTDIDNSSPTTDIILPGDQDIINNGIEIKYDGQNWIGFYTASNFIRILNFGSNLSNIPNAGDIIETSVIPNVNNIGDIEIESENGNWFGFIIGYSSKTLIKLNFGTSLFSNPTSTNITPPLLSSFQPFGIKLIREVDSLYGFITTFNGNLIRLNYGASINNSPVTINLGNFGGALNRTLKADITYYKSQFIGLTTNYSNNSLLLFQFPNICSSLISFSTDESPKVRYNESASYYIGLSAYNDENADYKTKKITINTNQAPKGQIILEPAYCIAANIDFAFNTNDDIVNYNWDFGDGNTSSAGTPTHQYATEGEYFISLTVESSAGCSNIFYDTLTIFPEPQPEFSTTYSYYCTYESIAFTNSTSFDYGDNVSWSWDFNGEGSSTAENPNFVFENPGTKIIRLEADVLGCVEIYQDTLEITDGPQVDFSFDSNCLGESVQFTNQSTGTNITSYLWEFGNGQTSTVENPQMTYNNPDTYAVNLTVYNANGCENTTTQNIRIFEQVVDSIHSTEAIENLPFDLGIEWSNDFDSTQNLTYQWEIDGEVQMTDTATFILSQGIYTVNLEIITEKGCLFNAQRTIEVKESEFPSPDFNLPSSVCLEEQFQLENTSINVDRYEWGFCNGDLKSNDLQVTEITSGNLSTPVGTSIVKFDNMWYGFITNIANNTITRLDFGDSLHNSPSVSNLGNLGGLLSNPQDIKAVVENGVLFLFVSNRTTNKFIRINMGSNVNNTSPSTDILLSGDAELQNNGIDVVFDGQDWVAVYTSTNFLRLLRLGESPGNTPATGDIINTSSLAGLSSLGDISYIRIQNEWYSLIVDYSANKIYRLDFGVSIFSDPNVSNITPTELSAETPYSVNLEREGLDVYAFVSTFSGNLLRLDFSNNILNTPVFNNLGKYGVLNRMLKTDIAFEQSKYFGLSTNYFSNKIFFIEFPNNCEASVEYSQEVNLVTSFSQPGTYPITLTAYHPNGNSASITKEITVTENQAPEIAFTTGEDLCVSVPIQFSSESNTEISSYSWDFGDGNTSSEANPAHLFSSAGEYLVQLSVSDTAGCNNLFQDSITIYAEPQPDFQASAQGSICSQKPVVFENTTTLPTTATFQWDFGDGNTSTEENPEHIYASEGEYIVNFQIEMAGCLVEKSDTITVNPGPLVDFNYSDDCFGQVVNFENSSTGDFLQSFQWDFGDGTQSTQTSPNHSYDSAGTYNVQLTALTSNGCDYSFQKEVIVHPVATVAFEAEVGCANQPLQFNEQVALQQSNITDYLWDFGVSGTTSDVSTEANPEFTFPSAGTYEVSLQVTTADGCTTSGTQTVLVNALPQPAFRYEDNCLNNAILFSPENTDNIVAHFWELQNAAGEVVITAQSENFSYAFENAGTYQLRYRQQNENLCSNSITETIEILPLPEPEFQVGSICANQPIFIENLTDLKGNTVKSYSWSINEAVVSTDFRPQYTFEESGDYQIALQVETQNGCIQTVEKTISVSPAPGAFFELEQSLAAFPYTLTLSAQSQGQTAVRPAKHNTDTNLITIKSKNSTRHTIPTSPLGTEGLVSPLGTKGLSTSPLGIEGLWTLNNDTISTTAQLNHTITQPGTYLLGLILTNEAGCTDSHFEQIRIREPNLDIALSNLRITQDQDFTGFVLNISNRGTLVPERLDLEIDLGSYAVTETIEEPLLPEQNRNVALGIKLTEEQIRGLAKICIRAIPHNDVANETYENNNRVCTNIETGLTIMEIYPNPVVTQFTLPIILPENAVLSLSLEQSNGQNVKAYSYDLEAGYHEIQLERGNIKPGIYFLRIRYQGKETVKKIIFQ